jgi:hypothetical protein
MYNYNEWNNAEGYGLFCGKKCAAARREAGILPKGGKTTSKMMEAQAEMMMAQAAIDAQKQDDSGWSPLAVAGVVGASLLGIALMIVIIKRAKK